MYLNKVCLCQKFDSKCHESRSFLLFSSSSVECKSIKKNNSGGTLVENPVTRPERVKLLLFLS